MSPSFAIPRSRLLTRLIDESNRLVDLVRAGRPEHADAPEPAQGDDDVSPHAARPADELTTTELLITTSRSLADEGEGDRAERARRLARVYLARRQRRLRDELDGHR